MRRYERLVAESGRTLGLRIAALQVPLRLHDYAHARSAASMLQRELDGQVRAGLFVDHLRLPLEIILDEQGSVIEQELKSRSETRKIIAHYWLGHVHLGRGDGQAALKSFDDCINSRLDGYTYQYWADCLRTRLRENINWPLE